MKLQRILDIRKFQIYKKEDKFYLITGIDEINKFECLKNLYEVTVFDDKGEGIENTIIKGELDDFTLIGFLGITHGSNYVINEIFELNKNEFNVDDILEKDNKKYIITNVNDDVIETLDENLYQHSFERKYINENEFKKAGILGLDYELINNNL